MTHHLGAMCAPIKSPSPCGLHHLQVKEPLLGSQPAWRPAKLPAFAKVAPAVCHVPGLFVSRSKGAPEQLMKVDHQMGTLRYRFVGPQLGPVELRVLNGLVALSAMQNPPAAASPESSDSLDQVQALLSRNASVKTTYNHLAQSIGYQADSGSAHASIRKALERLFAAAVFISRADDPGGKDVAAGHLLTQLKSREASKSIVVNLCPVLVAAIFGGPGEYLRVNLDEVRRLKSDPALLLHRRLHYLNAGAKARAVGLDTLVGYVWSEEARGNTHCKRRKRVREALLELKALGWSVTPAANSYLIGRPA